ncbi:endoplasmic reticulum-based factor for assembly of V-ATPase-domain-containing protein [Lipomyces arxii]|uniref:endoplasmic reticulum-based factor for assembly of V-ATPase-domain-containing protein n=1 Tax=Lipomyces arxii TaxID=56418 RepID=UPI0034CDE4F8
MKLTKTDRIKQKIELFNSKYNSTFPNQEYITHNLLTKLSIDLNVSLSSLLEGTEVYIPPKPEKKHDPEYDKRMNILRTRLQEQEYQSMIASALPSESYSVMEGFDRKELKNQISVIVNVLFSVASVGFAVWSWAAASLDVGKRLLLTMFACAIVLIAEVTLYLGYLQRISDAKKEEAAKKEVKTVLNTVEFHSKVN